MNKPNQILLLFTLITCFVPNYLFGNGSNFITPSNLKISSSSEKPPHRMSIEVMQKQFEAGLKSSGFLYDFAYALENHQLPYEEVVNKYLNQERKKKKLLTNKNQEFIFHFSENAQNEALNILLQEKVSFAKSYGLQNVEKKIKTALFNSTLHAALTKNDNLFKRVKQLTKKANLSDYTQFLYILESKYFEHLEDWKNYIRVTYTFMEKYDEKNAIFLNNQAISILKVKENREILKKAKIWIERSIFIDPQNYNYQTYAYILYKLGDIKAAKVAASKASILNKGANARKVVLPNTINYPPKTYSKT